MKKMKFSGIVLTLLLVLYANTTFAGIEVKNAAAAEANNTAIQKMNVKTIATGGKAIVSGVDSNSNSSTVVNEAKQLPQGSQNYQGSLPIANGDFGHLNTEFNLDRAGSVTWTTEGINTMISVMEETDGAEKWENICKRIKPNPIIVKRFSPTSSVSVMSPDEFRPEMVNQGTLIGFLIPDSEFNKNHPVLPLHLQAHTALNAMHFGSTHLVKLDQSFQSRFLSGSSGLSFNGIVSKLIGCDLGSVLGAGGGASSGKNSRDGNAGVTYMVLHLDSQPQVFVPVAKPVAVAKALPWWMEFALKGGKKHCPDKCINNACLRTQAAFDYALKGQWKKAENEAQIGQRDIAGGIEQDGTKTITLEAAPILAKVLRRIEMLSVREQFGRVSEVSLATKYRSMYGDTSMPTEIEDLYKNF